MISYLRFRYHARRNDFARALSCIGEESSPKNDAALWACYRLGMYRTVVNSTADYKTWRGSLAKTVSMAACGNIQGASELARQFAKNSQEWSDYHIAQLADALAPFDAPTALEILTGRQAPASLKAALLQANGQLSESARGIQSGMQVNNFNPELNLYLSNAKKSSPNQKLHYLNAFLRSHGLTPLALQNQELPLGPKNLVSQSALEKVDGPLVSILMTTYQSAERVEGSIRSLLNQTWKNIELIVVDDASSDNTHDIIERLAEGDDRIKFYKLPFNVGTYAAKRFGFEQANGEYVICHDSDDWSHPLKIEKQVKPLVEDSSLIFTTAHWVRMQDDGIYYARPVHPLMRLNPASPMFRREIVAEKAGLWDLVRTGADSEFLARLKLVFGRKAMKRIILPLTIGSHRPDSLMTARNTGHGEGGLSPVRLAYWEAWSHWHIRELCHGRLPHLPFSAASRAFIAPSEIIDSDNTMEQYFSLFDK